MFGYIKARRAERRARAAYDMAVLECMIAENEAALQRLREPEECRHCADFEKPKHRQAREEQSTAGA